MTPLAEGMQIVRDMGAPIATTWPTAPGWRGIGFVDGGDCEVEIGDADPALAEFLLRVAARIGASRREALRRARNAGPARR